MTDPTIARLESDLVETSPEDDTVILPGAYYRSLLDRLEAAERALRVIADTPVYGASGKSVYHTAAAVRVLANDYFTRFTATQEEER